MDFRTALALTKSAWTFGIHDPVLTAGSCFAASMGDRFSARKFDRCSNPFGTTYHPLAIHRLLRMAVAGEAPDPEGYVERQGTWYHHDFHSSFGATTQEELGRLLVARLTAAAHDLARARVIILTYGTALLFEQKPYRRPVANCHKRPAAEFTKRLSTPEEITADFVQTARVIAAQNPNARFILTVSPVRHVRDTLPLNQVSKSTLRLACHYLQEREPLVDYFPAYELMMDDLRDYRFYADDLIHPTPFAEEYIWQKFAETYFNAETRQFLSRWEPLRLALLHRPSQPHGASRREFLTSTLNQLLHLREVVNLDREIAAVQDQLSAQEP